jgi:hypothetical protein
LVHDRLDLVARERVGDGQQLLAIPEVAQQVEKVAIHRRV